MQKYALAGASLAVIALATQGLPNRPMVCQALHEFHGAGVIDLSGIVVARANQQPFSPPWTM